jgi:hypothetical protein
MDQKFLKNVKKLIILHIFFEYIEFYRIFLNLLN